MLPFVSSPSGSPFEAESESFELVMPSVGAEVGSVGADVGAVMGSEAGSVGADVGAVVGSEVGSVGADVGAVVGSEADSVEADVGAVVDSEVASVGAEVGAELASVVGVEIDSVVGVEVDSVMITAVIEVESVGISESLGISEDGSVISIKTANVAITIPLIFPFMYLQIRLCHFLMGATNNPMRIAIIQEKLGKEPIANNARKATTIHCPMIFANFICCYSFLFYSHLENHRKISLRPKVVLL